MITMTTNDNLTMREAGPNDELFESTRMPSAYVMSYPHWIAMHKDGDMDEGSLRRQFQQFNFHGWIRFVPIAAIEMLYKDEIHLCPWCDEDYVYDDAYDDVCVQCIEDGVVNYCETCNEWCWSEDSVWVNDETSACSSCARNTYWCDGCAMYHWEDDRCEYNDGRRYEWLRSYHDNPRFNLIGDDGLAVEQDPKRVFFGLELETENANDWIEDNIELERRQWRNVWACEDSSLDNGAELITMPATLNAWRDGHVIPWNDPAFTQFPSQDEYRSNGLHVHVSRSAFRRPVFHGHRGYRHSSSHMYRLLQFFEWNQYAIEIIGERSSTSYASWDGKQRMFENRKDNAKPDAYGNKYNPINIGPRETIEFRIFNGTMNKDKIMKAIEFVSAVVEYTRKPYPKSPHSARDQRSYMNFVEWVLDNRADVYPHLNDFHMEHAAALIAAAARSNDEAQAISESMKPRKVEQIMIDEDGCDCDGCTSARQWRAQRHSR